MKCPNCGVENDENALYCYFCGRVLPGKAPNANMVPEADTRKKKSNTILKIMLGVLGGLLAASLAFLAVMVVRDNKSEKEGAKNLQETADALFEEQDYMTAAARYDQLLEQDPDNDDALRGSVMSKLYFVSEELGSYATDKEYVEASTYLNEFRIDELLEDASEIGIEFPIICENSFGTVGFYQYGENEYYSYVGNYEDGVRSGFGCVIASNVSDFVHGTLKCYVAYGDWEDDKPNGYMEVIKDSNVGQYTYQKGNVVDGIWDGDVIYIGIGYNDEYVFELVCEYKDGLATPLEEIKTAEGKYYRISKDNDEYGVVISVPVDAADMTCGIISFADNM